MSVKRIGQNLRASHASLLAAAPSIPQEYLSSAGKLIEEVSSSGEDMTGSESAIQKATCCLHEATTVLNALTDRLPHYELHLNNYLRQINAIPLPGGLWPNKPPAATLRPGASPSNAGGQEDTPYTHVLWDWDGTLAKTLHLWLEAYRITLRANNLTIADKEIASNVAAFRQYLIAQGHSKEKAGHVVETARGRVIPQSVSVGLYPGGKQTVAALAASGIKQAVVTASRRALVEPPIRHHGLGHYFGTIVPGDEGPQKPNREPVDRALRELGGTASRAIIIGDSWKDLAAAKNAHIESILFYPPEHTLFYDRSELLAYSPTYVVSDLREIPDLLRPKK